VLRNDRRKTKTKSKKQNKKKHICKMMMWKSMYLALSISGAAGEMLESPCVRDVDPTSWLRECVGAFQRTNYTRADLSNYELIEKPSGLCSDFLSCAFVGCNSTGMEALAHIDLSNTNYSSIAQSLPPLNLPNKIVEPLGVGDVVSAFQLAKARDLTISFKNGGHSYAGSSNQKGSLQLNLRQFPKYSRSSVQRCVEVEEGDAAFDACALAKARNKSAVVRVGGGELWDDVYRSVIDWNRRYGQVSGLPEKGLHYEVVGGGAGTVSAVGGWMQGGGLSYGIERLVGLGVDQVLELEMVLASGDHVKFGPSNWTQVDGFIYPKTTAVRGKCNKRPKNKESKWEWKDCGKKMHFDELWKAVRGGGGGTYGMVTGVYYQLHDAQIMRMIGPNETVKTLILKEYNDSVCDSLNNLFVKFLLSVLYKPSALSLTGEDSNNCGSPGTGFALFPSTVYEGHRYPTAEFGSMMLCRAGVAPNILAAWKRYLNETVFEEVPILVNSSMDLARMLVLVPTISPLGDYASTAITMSDSAKSPIPIGHVPDLPLPFYKSETQDTQSILLPTKVLQDQPSWLVTIVQFSTYHTLGGMVNRAHDQATAINPLQRVSGCQGSFPNVLAEIIRRKLSEEGYWVHNESQYAGGEFEYNHMAASAFGPLKSDLSASCPSNYTQQLKIEHCLSAQMSVWGEELLGDLETIKKKVDPKNLFTCYHCVGHTLVN